MKVTGAATKPLFCEGEPTSLDALLLNRLVVERSDVLVIPVRGKSGMRASIEGYLLHYRTLPQYLAFRDRDFDSTPTDDIALIRLPGPKPIYLSHRACVESYLLDAALIDRYWVEHAAAPKWQHGQSPGKGDILGWMDKAADNIAAYQAARWALATLKPSARWPELPTTWTDGSGHLPDSGWLTDAECLQQARILVNTYSEQAGKVSEPLLEERFREYVDRFATPTFRDGRQYQAWFHGKDLSKAMQRLRPNAISMRHFFSWAAKHVSIADHPDLQDLKNRI